jgi:hypothetical protein
MRRGGGRRGRFSFRRMGMDLWCGRSHEMANLLPGMGSTGPSQDLAVTTRPRTSFLLTPRLEAKLESFKRGNDMFGRFAIRVTACVALSSAVVGLACVAVAGAQPASAKIAPHQTFIGMVNGEQINASIDVECPGPVRVGQMGHPTGGQTIGVSTPAPPIAGTGNTGSRGRSITAQFVTPSTAAPSAAAPPKVTFSEYGTLAIPTTGVLPCNGSGAVVFSALPTSHTARSGKVSVSYVATCTNPCPVVERQ